MLCSGLTFDEREREREGSLYWSFGRKPNPNHGELTPVLRELSMADNETSSFSSKVVAPSRPTIALPPRSSMDSFFFAATSPGPMTLVSAFFSDNYPDSDCRSFSQLLAGAMASPGARPTLLSPNSINHDPSEDAADNSSLGFRQNRPMTLAVAHSPMFSNPLG